MAQRKTKVQLSKRRITMSEEIVRQILSSEGTIRGNCLNCGKPFFRLLKKMREKNNLGWFNGRINYF